MPKRRKRKFAPDVIRAKPKNKRRFVLDVVLTLESTTLGDKWAPSRAELKRAVAAELMFGSIAWNVVKARVRSVDED